MLNIKDIGTLSDLRTKLMRFSSDVDSTLRTADSEIRKKTNWLDKQVARSQREVKGACKLVKRCQIDLDLCESSGYRDSEGRYHRPDCSRQRAAVRRAEGKLIDNQKNLKKAQAWRSRVIKAVDQYRRLGANRLRSLTQAHTQSAMVEISHIRIRYEAVHGASIEYSRDSSGTWAAVVPQVSSSPVIEGPRESILWAEKSLILKKIDYGIPLSKDELHALSLPISDLRAETIQQEYSWVQQLIEAERFREATAGLWNMAMPVASWSSLAWAFLGVGAETLKVIQCWKDRD